MRHVREIDGLRAVAVAAIVLFHVGVPGLEGGYVGVDVFYVISGYLITGIIAPEIVERRFDLVRFYERRIRRLAPALLALLVLVALLASRILMPLDFADFGVSILAALFFSSNVLFWREHGYFGKEAIYTPLLHTWSLAVEEQFYLAFPLFLLVCHRLFRKKWQWPVVAVFAASLLSSVYLTPRHPEAAFYLPVTRAWELMLGAWVAFKHESPPHPLVREIASALGMGMIGMAVLRFTKDTPFPGLAALVPCGGSALLIWASEGTRVGSLLRLRPVVGLGLISYSLYLWHWPLLVLDRYWHGGSSGLAATLTLLGVVTLAATLSWRFVENPIRHRRILRSRRALFSTVAVGASLIAIAALAITLTDGVPRRFPPDVARLDSFASHRDETGYACANRSPDDVLSGRLCIVGDARREANTLLWGDSQAAALQSVVGEAMQQRELAARVATMIGCPPLFGVRREAYEEPCDRFSEAVRSVLQRSDYRRVLLVGHWRGYANLLDLRDDGPAAEPAEVLRRSLERTIADLRTLGVELLIADPIPGALRRVPRALAEHAAYGGGGDVAFTRAEFVAHNAPFFRAIDDARVSDSARWGPWKDVCQSGSCEVMSKDGSPLYFDAVHPAWPEFRFAEASLAAALTE
jgi:peptidoglycan/LPS O-acetylase OafA/YrhL